MSAAVTGNTTEKSIIETSSKGCRLRAKLPPSSIARISKSVNYILDIKKTPSGGAGFLPLHPNEAVSRVPSQPGMPQRNYGTRPCISEVRRERRRHIPPLMKTEIVDRRLSTLKHQLHPERQIMYIQHTLRVEPFQVPPKNQ